LKADESLTQTTDESYNITISGGKSPSVQISAKTWFGARHGLTTLQQLIWFEDDSFYIYSFGEVFDAPKFNYRGLMLDTARHYFSVTSIKRTLDAMAYCKLNRFHWHITDSQSFPFVSINFPEMAASGAYSAKEVYTHSDISEIVQYAKVRGIQVIPEIDAPAHAGNGWDWGVKKGLGQLSLCINQQPWSYFCGQPPCGQLNPRNNNTYHVLEKLYQELLDLTGPLDLFHLGGDEVNLECWGQHFNDTDLNKLWCDFMINSFQRMSKNSHKPENPPQGIVWSSGLTANPCLSNKNFIVQIWGASTWQENRQLIEDGFKVIFSHVDAWYLDCGFGSWRTPGEAACSPYRSWQNVYLHRPWESVEFKVNHLNQILGGEVCLWTEQVDESQLDARLWPRSAALAERLWSDPVKVGFDSVSPDVFSRMSLLRDRLVLYGIQAEPIFPKYCSQNPNECL